MIIYGAGMSGLLAAHMLRRYSPIVRESADSLPNNHAALLRFRTDVVSKATGIPFKKVFVQKAVLSYTDKNLTTSPTIKDQNLYALKVGDAVMARSIMNMAPGERYIAPPNFIEQLAKSVDIEYGAKLEKVDIHPKEPTISTIPMNELMRIAGWSDMPKFNFKSIITITAEITQPSIDVYQTVYDPSPYSLPYRISITGNKLIIEMVKNQHSEGYINNTEMALVFAKMCLRIFFEENLIEEGAITVDTVEVKAQKYGKLIPLEGKARKEFILAMTDVHNVYSLGRFSTWRQILMDDVVNDVNIIEAMIEQRDSYSRRLNYRK